MVTVQLYPIAPQLTQFVRRIWTLDLALGGNAIDLRMTADCYPHLVIRCERSADGLWLPGGDMVPIATLKGVSTQSITYKMSPSYSHIAVSFYPNAVRNIFGINAYETVNQLIGAEYFLPKETVEQIIVARSHTERSALLNTALITAIGRRNPQPDKRTADFLFNHKDAYQKKLTEYNVSERHFRRLFFSDVGISPAFYKRLYRFEATLASIRNEAINNLTELAYRFDYADQAHFCKEFRAFTGESPYAFIKKDRVFEDSGTVERPHGTGHLIGASM
jgi:AraC-type DNA-binding domain-containing proteins